MKRRGWAEVMAQVTGGREKGHQLTVQGRMPHLLQVAGGRCKVSPVPNPEST